MPIQYLWHHWFRKRYELVALSAILIISSIISKAIAISHWHSLQYQIPGVSPWSPYFIFIWAGGTMGLLFLHNVKSVGLWVIPIIGSFYGMLLFYILELSGQNVGLLGL